MNGSDDKKTPGKLKDIEGFAEKKDFLDKFFTDRKVESTNAFTKKANKGQGLSAGYEAKRNSDEHTFLLKSARLQARKDGAPDEQIKREETDRRDLVNEYIIAPLYQRLLFDRAPIFELTVNAELEGEKLGTPKVKSSKDGMIYGRSKFFDDFQTLGDFQKNSNEEIEGFEKVVAACLFAGDIDYHDQNLGVVKKDGKNIMVKIDHGKSGMQQYGSLSHLSRDLDKKFLDFRYADRPFKQTAFKQAIDEMIKISDEEIEAIIYSRIDKLVKAGFKFGDMKFYSIYETKDSPVTKYSQLIINDEEKSRVQLKQFYLEKFKANRDILKQLSNNMESDRLDVISKIEITEDQKIVLRNDSAVDLILYAINNNLKIDGKDPILYAAEKRFRIDAKDPILYAINNNLKIDGKDPVLYAVEKGLPINIQNAIIYAINNNLKIDGEDPILYTIAKKINFGKLEPLAFAANYNIKINGLNAIDYAAKNDLKIHGKDPIRYAINNKILIDGEHPARYAVNNKRLVDGENAEKFLPEVLMKGFLNDYMNSLKEKDGKSSYFYNSYENSREFLIKEQTKPEGAAKNTALPKLSYLEQFLNSAPSFIIAEKLGAAIGKNSGEATELDLTLLAHYNIHVMARVVKIMNHIDKGLEDRPLTYYLHKFVECISSAIGFSATDQLLFMAKRELNGIINKEESVDKPTQQNGFVDKVLKANDEKAKDSGKSR